MEYVQEQFPYGAQHPHHHPHQPIFYQPVPYGAFPGPQLRHQQLDEFGHPYHAEYAEFLPYQEEFEEAGEPSTRPRLTKEQAEVLEAHFQANHKPNSVVKRQLAMQTKLTLARVANWFQNRRAKAKQQRKQEEYENSNAQGLPDGVDDDDEEDQPEAQAPVETLKPHSRTESQQQAMLSDESDAIPSKEHTTSKDLSWASLQRAIRQAELGKSQHTFQQTQMQRSPSSEVHQQPHPVAMPMSAPHTTSSFTIPTHWQGRNSLMDAWSPTGHFEDRSFDFGFEQQDSAELCRDNMTQMAPPDFVPDHHSVSQDSWLESLPTPRGIMGDHGETHFLGSPDMPLPHYPESRRGSAAESLTANFGTFALASESPQIVSTSMPTMMDAIQHPEGHLDIAARRKRPRPAALTSASLRSRSYGALTSVSPTMRPGMSPTAHTVRHVKSTGHSLNARFSGIRKATSAQRSPINISTFAEAEALNRLLAQRSAAAAQAHGYCVDSVEGATPLVSPGLSVDTRLRGDENTGFMVQNLDLAGHYQLPNTQHLTLSTMSPPVTPFHADFAQQTHHLSMPPVSAPQYATFPDNTPPYSAGPLTNSSWSDAPLTSPEIPNFPQMSYIPSLHQLQKMESPQQHFQQYVLQSDNKPEMSHIISTPEQKRTEFLIQEFPNQKEEHAHVAQQLAQNGPKSYVFSNSAASDYDQS